MKTLFKILPSLLFVLSTGTTAFAGPKEDWEATGITLSFFEENFLKECGKNDRTFIVCIEALSGVFTRGKFPGAFIVPKSASMNPVFEIVEPVPDTNGNLVAVRLKATVFSNEEDRIEYALKVKQQQKKSYREYAAFFREKTFDPSALRKLYAKSLGEIPLAALKSYGKARLAGELTNMALGILFDPHTRLEPAIAFREKEAATVKGRAGVGAGFEDRPEGIVVKEVYDLSPAFNADLRRKDRILKVNGVSTDGMSFDEFVARMSGEVGSEVSFEVLRRGRTLSLSMVREKRGRIAIQSFVKDRIRVGVLKINSFMGENLYDEFVDGIQRLIETDIKMLVLDVRGNAGGSLKGLLQILSLFVGDQPILKGVPVIDGIATENFSGALDRPMLKGRLIVLQDRDSKSSAEILSGVLKHYGAIVVGQPSFGKSVAQEPHPLPDPFLAAAVAGSLKNVLTFTTVTLYTFPDGSSAQNFGVIPDVVIESDPFKAPLPLDLIRREADYYSAHPGTFAQGGRLTPMEASMLQSCVDEEKKSLCEFGMMKTKARYQIPEYPVVAVHTVLDCVKKLSLGAKFGWGE